MRLPPPVRSNRRRALSLVEVLVAIGIFAVAVVSVVALFGPAVRATREVSDRRAVLRLGEGIDVELRRAGWGPVTAALAGGAHLQLFARADGTHVVLSDDADNDPEMGTPPGIAPAERYFAIEVSAAPGTVSSPACVVVAVRVTWPAALPPDGDAPPVSRRSHYNFHTAVNR